MTRQNDSGESTPVDRPKLADLHERCVAVQLSLRGQDRLLVGHAVFDPDHPLGRVLRIHFREDPSAEILLEEAKWTDPIVPGGPPGCDFLIRLDAAAP